MRRASIGWLIFLGFFIPPVLGLAESPLVRAVEIRGTRRPVEMETRAGQRLDLSCVERDVRRLWATGWFDDIRAETSESAQGVELIFTLAEKPRLYLRRIKFEPARARQPLGFEKGTPVDIVWAKRVAGELRRKFVEEGYAGAKVEAELIPAGGHQADLRLHVERGRFYRVGEVRFSGLTGLKPGELRTALRSTLPRRLLPGLGSIWAGWRLLAPFSDARLQADVDRLRSLYLSRGYFDAQVEVAGVDIREGKATVTIAVNSGRHYRVSRLEIAGGEVKREMAREPGGKLPAQELCECLLKAQRKSEEQGRFPFAASLELEPTPRPLRAAQQTEPGRGEPGDERAADEPTVALRAKIEPGPVYRIERIEFSGTHKVSDLTLRRALLLREGDLFDQALLRRSLARLNRFAFLEPIGVGDVKMKLAEETQQVKLTIPIKEKPRGGWSFSGPFGSLDGFGALQYRVASRLPALGHGPLEVSTFYASFSLLAWPLPGVGLLSAPRTIWRPVMALGRPYLPGKGWSSGFLLSPQLGWQGTLASYGLSHANQAAHTLLKADSLPTPPLYVPASWRPARSDDPANIPTAGVLLCERRKPPWTWLQGAGAKIADAATQWLMLGLL